METDKNIQNIIHEPWYRKVLRKHKDEIIKSTVISIVITVIFSLWYFSLGKTFDSYNCITSDCSGHEAGYNWAEKKGISDSNDCGGNSNSFIEGCKAYVDENY
jgi:hypothetical protein